MVSATLPQELAIAAAVSSSPRGAKRQVAAASPDAHSSLGLARMAAKGSLASSDAAYALVCGRTDGGVSILSIVTSGVEIVVKDQAAALLVYLAGARRGTDGLPRWSSVGDVLLHVGATSARRIDRHRLRTLIRYLQRCLERCDIQDLVQTHRSRGVRLTTFPSIVIWWSAARRRP